MTASHRRTRQPIFAMQLLAMVLLLAAGGILASRSLLSDTVVACTEQSHDSGLALHCQFTVAAPPDAVWSAFTGTETPRPYYFDAVLQAEMKPGGRWRFVTDDRERLLAGGEISVIDPGRLFEHTFMAAELDDPASRIRVSLREIEGGCGVSLVHDRFATRSTTFRRFRRAHPLALSALKAFLEDGELPWSTRLYTALFKPGMKIFTVRAEPWGASGEMGPVGEPTLPRPGAR